MSVKLVLIWLLVLPASRSALALERRLERMQRRGALAAVARGRVLARGASILERRLQDWRLVGFALFVTLLAMAAIRLWD